MIVYSLGFVKLEDLRLSHDMRKPTMWLCVTRRLRSTLASGQSEQSLCFSLDKKIGCLLTNRAYSEDSIKELNTTPPSPIPSPPPHTHRHRHTGNIKKNCSQLVCFLFPKDAVANPNSVGRCVIPWEFLGKSVKHIFSCREMYSV